MIMGSGIPLCWYPFACEPTHHARNVFLAVLTISSCTTFLMIMIPAISKPKFRPLRVALFITLGVSDVVPFIYLKNYSNEGDILLNSTMPWVLGVLFYVGGALLYVFRFPEKYFPKMFDKLGTSH